jgi:hypothetical protein
MKATMTWLGALLLAAAATSAVRANGPCGGGGCNYCWYPQLAGCRQYPQAPDACHGGGFYCTNPYGQSYGPNYNIRPPFAPYSGVGAPGFGGFGSQIVFPTHPYARSPRDFFMYGDP